MPVVSKLLTNLQGNRAHYCKNSIIRCQSAIAAADTLNANTAAIEDYSNAKPYKQIPSPKGLPILGNLWEFTKKENQINAIAMHHRYVKELGPIYKIKVPSMEFVIITKAEDSQAMYVKDGTYPVIPTFELFERIRKGPLSHLYPTTGLLSTAGDEWHKARSLVQQDLMRPKSALFYIDDLDEIMDQFIMRVEEQLSGERNLDDIRKVLSEYALDAIGVMFIGSKLGVLQGSEYGKKMIEKVEKAFELSMVAMGIPPKIAPYIPIYKECVNIYAQQYEELVQHLGDIYIMSRKVIINNIERGIFRPFILLKWNLLFSSFIQQEGKGCGNGRGWGDKINEAIKKHEKDGSLEGTILAKMIDRCGADSGIPVVMANDAMFAGIDTTGNTASILLYHLATNLEKQETLYQEIVKVVGKNGKMTEEALAEMRYLKACQQESARMAPVALGTARSTNQDMVMSGYQIPKGTFVIRIGFLMSNSGEYFTHPEQFLPERWIRGCPQHEKQKNPFANIPFGHGPRACVGQRFAKLELYMAVFKLIQKYKISYEGPELGISYQGMGHLNGPLALKFEERN